ncbi:MAG: class II aldolase/adducin family protein [Alphaproteobacteria bacterium]
MSASALSAARVGPASDDAGEREIRVQLAACYRLLHRYAMTDLIYTHVSARLPGREGHFLLNPYGLMFDEITASNLIEVDGEGNAVGDDDWPVNPAGFVIHSAVLDGRKDVNCVLHTHTRAGIAVSTLECGLLPISQHALQFYNRIAYHDYEGIACDLDERRRLVADLGDCNAMVLRNHGLLTVGRSVGEAFLLMFNLEQACKIQIDAQATGSLVAMPSEEVCEHTARQFDAGANVEKPAWRALLRQLDRDDPSYRD